MRFLQAVLNSVLCFSLIKIFHRFPPDRKKRDHWLESLDLTPKDYHNGAKVCYRHFKTSDYSHNNPRQALKKTAVPALKVEDDSDAESLDIDTALEKLNEVTSSESDGGGDVDDYISAEELSIPSSDDEPPKPAKKRKKTAIKKNQDAKVKKEVKKNAKVPKAVKISEEDLNTHLGLQVCRICLVTGCKMFSMSHYNLENTYLLLTGITAEMFDSSKMPQMLCYECLQRLLNFIEFSTKSLTSWTCLMELIEGDILTMDTIKNINRKQHLLETKLALTVFEPNHFDLQVEEYEEEIGDQKLEDIDKEMLEDTIDKEIDETIDKEIDETIDKEILYLEDGTIVETEYQDGETKDKSASEDDDDLAKHESDFGLQNSDDENDIDKNYDYSVRKTNIVTQYAKEFNEMFEVIKMTEEDARDEINKRKFTDHYKSLRPKHV
ncbi:uncharacterized protein LOC114360650 [Ostrinia furnacalis]|uniref:uncharacterized protein LOC114360650 n=1 Tax=Ostrinia furnacalis TaxID=93504 RepID=UPI00103AB246|nr:uncharacterized protein LOC114360650 [Ostrinia furnacalis]